jgi:transposase InsO family protein
MDERVRFIADHLTGAFTLAELCRRYGISRPTGYELIRRYQAEGPSGLAARSRRPHTHPQATAAELVQAIVAARRKHPTWGPVTIVNRLRVEAPDRAWPAPSTAGAILKAHRLIAARRRRPPAVISRRPTTAMDAPNVVWTIDFKGEFRTRDAAWCYPLTVMDGCSRYLLACQALAAPRMAPTRAVLERVFSEYGLPARIRSDNGVPFAGPTTLARLSRLSVWWIRLGIVPELIQPGCPAQNGRHERMHRTLKRQTAWPPAGNRAAQQRRFGVFRREYNEERPHAALNALTPAMVYVPSSREVPARVPPIMYPGHYDVRVVMSNGCMKWRNHVVSVSDVLVGEPVGLEEIEEGEWAVYFGPVRLGTVDERSGRIHPYGCFRDGRSPALAGSR